MHYRLSTLSLLFLFLAVDLVAQCPSGRIRNAATGSTQDIELCTNDGVSDEITFSTDFQPTSALAAIVTDKSGEILLAVPGQTVDFEGFTNGESQVFLVSYTGTLTATIGENVYSIDLSTDCFRLSSNNIDVEHNAPIAGTIADKEGNSLVSLCVGDNSPDYISYDVDGDDSDRYVYLITDLNGNVEKVDYNDYEDFGFDDEGTSLVYGLAFNGDLKIRAGENIFTDQLVDGCFDLTDNFLTIVKNEVDGGRIRVNGERHIDVDSTTTQAPVVTRTSSSSAPFIYVIIDEAQEIRGFSQGPAVDMSFLPEGKYWIYVYSYTGVIQAEVGQHLWNSGVRFATGCFDRGGAVVVEKETPADPTTSNCTADAGSISATSSQVTIQNGIASVTATLDGNAVVPAGYDSVYFLTSGPTETIIALSLASPDFSVTTAEVFTIYYLNAEITDSRSAEYLDLSFIQFGSTSIGDLASVIMDNRICADLTIPGAEITVNPDPVAPCLAFASSALPTVSTVPLSNGEALLEATPDGGAALPSLSGELTYVLSQGAFQTIIAIGNTPEFTVTEVGQYAIHPLSAETSDPTDLNFLDRRDWVTNGLDIFDVFDIILAEGICADIDFDGAQFQVTSGSSCAAESGTLTAVADTVFLNSQSVRIEATADGNAVVPFGFDRTYVLTSGPNKIVESISARPRFDVTQTGQYHIHAWVGEFTDPLSVDYVNLTAIQQGVAPITDIELFIQGSGICSSLDGTGAAIYVDQIIPTLSTPIRTSYAYGYLRVGNVYSPTPQPGKLVLMDQLGRMVTSKTVQLSDHPQSFEMEVLNAPGGLYFLTLVGSTDGVLSSKGVVID